MNATLELGPDGLRLIPGEHELHEPAFECFVLGHPRPQGSKSQGRNGQMYEASDYVKAWRANVWSTALKAQDAPFRGCGTLALDGPLVLGAEFLFPRPGTIRSPGKHFTRCTTCRGKGTVAHAAGPGWGRFQCSRCAGRGLALRPDAPVYVTCTPDLDKLLRAAKDGLTDAGVWTDDSRVVGYAGWPTTCKRYANPGEEPGVWLRVWRVV